MLRYTKNFSLYKGLFKQLILIVKDNLFLGIFQFINVKSFNYSQVYIQLKIEDTYKALLENTRKVLFYTLFLTHK